MLSPHELSAISKKLTKSVQTAGEIILANWSKPRQISHKSEIDLVTDTDFAVQEFLQKELLKILPGALFFGEENFDPEQRNTIWDDNLRWVVDPLDGTTNFVHGIPCVAISAALCCNGRPLAGIVFQPLARECFLAVKNQGAMLNGKAIHASHAIALQECVCATGSLYAGEEDMAALQKQIGMVLRKTQALRMPGSAAINLAYVACGRLDAFFESHLKPWDVAAGWLLVEEANGKVADYTGNAYEFWRPICASGKNIHSGVLELLQT